MHTTLTTLIDRLDSRATIGTAVIRWGSPVPAFGNPSRARVATLGLNPSNREFVDKMGRELEGGSRRFHTLRSLGLSSWSDVDARHLSLILDSCYAYFDSNPYDLWFRKLDRVISGTEVSFYDTESSACHLDLIPYATEKKWVDLSAHQRASLVAVSGNTLALLLRDSSVRALILNGRSVVEHFQNISGVRLSREEMPEWALPRRRRADVAGFAYRGLVDSLSGEPLQRQLLVLGYNHNIQSSFGVTNKVIQSINGWVSESCAEVLQ